MKSKTKQIGIMGGTFDPIHCAHLALAKKACEEFCLDSVWILPNGNPPHKKDSRQADVRHRMNMASLAIQGIDCLELCTLEADSSEYHYTYETLQHLNAQYPDTQFYFIMGADSLFYFDEWYKPEIISQESVLLVATRDHSPAEELLERMEFIKDKFQADIRLLHTPNMDISSEEIRSRIRHGQPLLGMVPEAVEQYIYENQLYQDTQEEF